MDLYVQVGMFLVMATMFALVIYFYGISTDIGVDAEDRLYKDSVDYSYDTSITSPTFYVDHRVFVQWAMNASDQRSVYLVYPQAIRPANNVYGQYMRELDIELDTQDKSARKIEVLPQTNRQVSNAFEITGNSGKIVDYLRVYAEHASTVATDKTITVHTFTDPETRAVIYVCFIK